MTTKVTCGHDKQESLTLSFETEVCRRQPKGEMKSEVDFKKTSVKIASKCMMCGEVLSSISDEEVTKAVDKALYEFFK